MRIHKDVWILHPEHRGTAVAKGRAGVHYKVSKSKLPLDKPCKNGIQWISIEDVFVPAIVPMYATKQNGISILEDALASSSNTSTWLMWNAEYLQEVL